MNDQFIRDVLNYIQEYIRLYVPLMSDAYRDLHFGTSTVDDQSHARWFMLKTMQNPNWARALPLVEGGLAEVRRFERTMGIKLDLGVA